MKTMKKILPILLLAFPFLLANSPYPYVYPEPYEEFTNTPFTKILIEPDDGLEYFEYETTVTNTGEGYIYLYETTLASGTTNVANFDSTSFPDYDLYLAPSNSYNLVFSTDVDLTVSSLSLKCFAYLPENIDSTATYSNVSSVTRDPYLSYGRSKYNFNANMTYDENYNYTILVNFTYDEIETRTYECNYSNTNTGSLYFLSSDVLDPTKITIESFTFFKGLEHYSSDDSLFRGLMIAGLIIIVSIFAFGLTIAGIVIGIVFLIKAIGNKKIDSK